MMLHYVTLREHLADYLTKPLAPKTLRFLTERLSLRNCRRATDLQASGDVKGTFDTQSYWFMRLYKAIWVTIENGPVSDLCDYCPN